MASYLEAVKESLDVAIFQAASQLDLVSLQDHKNMLLLELSNWKGVFLLQQVLANPCLICQRYDLQLLQKLL